MPPIIPISVSFDQSTLSKLIAADPIVQRYRALFALFDWSPIDAPARRGPGKPAHPQSAYFKAALVRINEHLSSTPRWRAYLLDHPLLVLELGLRPHLDFTQPYGFDVARTVPSVRWLNEWVRTVDCRLLCDLFEQSVQALRETIPDLGEVVAYDVKHIYANVKENNPRVWMQDRFCKDRQSKGDPDCRVGVKKSTNQEQPDGSKKVVKVYLWGYGSGVAAAIVPGYGMAILDEDTHPYNENDIEHFPALALQTVGILGSFLLHICADAAFDARSRLSRLRLSWGHGRHPAQSACPSRLCARSRRRSTLPGRFAHAPDLPVPAYLWLSCATLSLSLALSSPHRSAL